MTLLQLVGPLWEIEVDQRLEARLDVDPDSTLFGRSEQDASRSGCEEARRELTGEPDADPKEAALESAPESERWDPVAGSNGHEVPVPSGDDEDDEGRSDNERLVEEGIAAAEHDHLVQAARAAEKKDRG